MNFIQILFHAALIIAAQCHIVKEGTSREYDPIWEDLDKRPLPEWFDQSKIGIFIHWGLYSVPSYINEWFWLSWKSHESEAHAKYMEKNYKPGFSYQVEHN